MKERVITQRLQAWLKKRGWIVYKPPDTYGADTVCPTCVREGRDGTLYCRTCAKEIEKDMTSRFTPYKPADLAVLQSPISWGGWIEVKQSKARTEKGMTFRPKYVKPHQAKAMAQTDGFLALAFVQERKPEKEQVIGVYLVRWAKIMESEVVTRAEIRELAEITVKDSPEVVPVVVRKEKDPAFAFMDQE